MNYGIDIKTLEKFIAEPTGEVLITNSAFRLEKRAVKSGDTATVGGDANFELTLWIEEGSARIDSLSIKQYESINLPAQKTFSLRADADTVAYLFYGPVSGQSEYMKARPSFDKREKYWGTIESIVSKDYAAKRMLVKKGTQASLEYHCRKTEGYYIHSGKLLLRLRAGRGEDRFFELESGKTAFTPPGLMHQRGGLEDTVIIEISTRDEDSDSYLVEDGQVMNMPRLGELLSPVAPGKKTICVDLDGCICTATEGNYEAAEPQADAIQLVNTLHDEGHRIVVFTARFMGRTHGTVSEAYALGYSFTKKQLATWGVKYHELRMGKPAANIYIDDRAIFFTSDWKKIAENIRSLL